MDLAFLRGELVYARVHIWPGERRRGEMFPLGVSGVRKTNDGIAFELRVPRSNTDHPREMIGHASINYLGRDLIEVTFSPELSQSKKEEVVRLAACPDRPL